MGRRPPPALEGHLDLLLLVRRLFRYRLPDARLQTVERHLLRRHRAPDIPAWEIPAVYHSFLRGGPAGPIRVVARHNAEDVVTLGRILAHLERGYGDGEVRRWAPPGDLIRLARLYRHEARFDEAVDMPGDGRRGGRRPAIRTSPWPPSSWRGCCAAMGRLAEAGVAWSRLVDGAGAAGRARLDRAGQGARAPRRGTWRRPGRPRTRPCWLYTAAAGTGRRCCEARPGGGPVQAPRPGSPAAWTAQAALDAAPIAGRTSLPARGALPPPPSSAPRPGRRPRPPASRRRPRSADAVRRGQLARTPARRPSTRP